MLMVWRSPPKGSRAFFELVLPHLNERQRRVVAGSAAQLFGNKTAVAEAAGMSRNTVIKAEAEVEAGMEPEQRQRPPGAGQKPITETQPGILEDLDRLVHPETRGNPTSLLRWTSKSTSKLAEELVRQGYQGLGRQRRPAAQTPRLLAAGPLQAKRGARTPTVTASSVT